MVDLNKIPPFPTSKNGLAHSIHVFPISAELRDHSRVSQEIAPFMHYLRILCIKYVPRGRWDVI